MGIDLLIFMSKIECNYKILVSEINGGTYGGLFIRVPLQNEAKNRQNTSKMHFFGLSIPD